ncbi:MAG TPA: hypothetical protein VGE88_03420 [Lysobacter sp.]
MTHLSSNRPPRKQGHFIYSLAVLILAAIAIYWSFVTLFPVELHQIGQWVSGKFAALTK